MDLQTAIERAKRLLEERISRTEEDASYHQSCGSERRVAALKVILERDTEALQALREYNPESDTLQPHLRELLIHIGWRFVTSHDNPLTNSAVPDCWIHDDCETAWSIEEAVRYTIKNNLREWKPEEKE